MTTPLSAKLPAGAVFPTIKLQDVTGTHRDIAAPQNGADWTMIVAYRGRHCPLCTKYLNLVESYRQRLLAIRVDLCGVSADSHAQLREHQSRLNVNFPLLFGLSTDQMESLGLYVSHPRSPGETDHPFAEPGLFVINADRRVHVVDVSNNPFVRPHVESLVSGLEWIRKPDNHYPIRGTYASAARALDEESTAANFDAPASSFSIDGSLSNG